MKNIIVVAPNVGAGTRINYEIAFNILASRKIIDFRIVREGLFTLEDLQNASYLILYRCIRGHTLSLARLAKRKGIRVIYEIDDDLLHPPEDEPWGLRHIRCGIPQIVKLFFETADLVKTGSPLLQERMREEGYPAIYQTFPVIMRKIDEDCRGAALRIGYFGTRHHQKDISLVFPALQAIEAEFPVQPEFEFIGCAPEGWRKLKRARFWNFDSDYERFLDTLTARQWTIGLAPLQPTRFNEAKSNGKFRDYTAAGIPGIYADLAPYRECVVHGQNGLLCVPEPREWVLAVRKMMFNPDRFQLVKKAREYIRLNQNPELTALNWESLLNSI